MTLRRFAHHHRVGFQAVAQRILNQLRPFYRDRLILNRPRTAQPGPKHLHPPVVAAGNHVRRVLRHAMFRHNLSLTNARRAVEARSMTRAAESASAILAALLANATNPVLIFLSLLGRNPPRVVKLCLSKS